MAFDRITIDYEKMGGLRRASVTCASQSARSWASWRPGVRQETSWRTFPT